MHRVARAAARGAALGQRRGAVFQTRALSGTSLSRIDSFVGVSSRGKKGRRSAEDAVNNILYNTPPVTEKPTRHIVSVLVDDSPGEFFLFEMFSMERESLDSDLFVFASFQGVLSKISGLLSARGFNIDSLTVSSTDVKELSRITIAVNGPDTQLEQVTRQLEDLVDVWAVIDYRGQSILERELAIVKVSCLPPPAEESDISKANLENASYDEMMASHFHRQAVLDIAKMFEARVADIGSESIILEMVSWSRRVDAFFRILEPYGIVEGARSGVIAMTRSTVVGGGDDEAVVKAGIDISDLPPS